MKNSIRGYLSLIKTDKTKRIRMIALILVLSLIVTFCVFWQLRLTGITMAGDAYCGFSEHTHSQECIKKTLICGFEEGVKHEHSVENGCYSADSVLICKLPELSEDHTHTEACYETTYICGKEEHTHTLQCYSNPSADIETANSWKATIPSTLSGMWADDLIEVAKSQLGYNESTHNYHVTDSGELKGYTRYGEWYGNPYGDWNAMFVSFCLYYAEIPQELFPYAAGCYTWTTHLQNAGLLESPDTYTPNPGDIVFFDPENAGVATHMGIIQSVETGDSEAHYVIHTIEGDSENAVREKKYSSDDAGITAYGNLGAAFDRYAQNFAGVAAMLSIDGLEFSAAWDEAAKQISGLQVTYTSDDIKRGETYYIQYSYDNGQTWVSDTASGFKAPKDRVPITLTASDTIFDKNTCPLDCQFRICNSAGKNPVPSNTFTVPDILDSIKDGFSDWLANCYVQYFNGTEPTDLEGLYTAFDLYNSLPQVTLSQSIVNDTQVQLNVAVDAPGNYTYEWEYLDDDTMWQSLTTESADQVVLADDLYNILAGGKSVHCKVYKNGQLVGVSNQLTVDSRQAEYDAAIDNINSELGLSSYGPSGADLSIGGYRFNTLFYYGNAARDPDVPFSDAESYKNYLAQVYLDEGVEAVKKVWDFHLYDLYDPNYDKGYMSNINEGYPDAATYGDGTLGWTKDAEKGISTPFHGNAVPIINDLNYDYLENGVDYSNFVTGLDKTAEAVSPGDSNTERLYDIDITADAQAKVNAPVALIFQIQTSWQMFDMLHANAVEGDGSTEVGAAAKNTELANLYDIKNALLRLVDYMDTYYPGSNLVMGITDVEHAGTFSMFNGQDNNGNPLFVTNDVDTLRQGILGWDTFGNCEHVHYTSDALEDAVANLQSNLYGWKDMYGYELQYEDIRKVGVIIGGPTENSDGESGYGITLPWGNFQSAGMNSIYGIRTNEGTPLNEDGYISWIDYTGNTSGTPFANGQGNAFTKKYVATNEDAIFNTLLNIVKTEMNAQGMDILNDEVFVENVTTKDIVIDEFILNTSEPITATIYKKDGVTVVDHKTISLEGANVSRGENGEKITVTADGSLTITEYVSGTTKLSYNFGNVKNMYKAALHFQVQAREDYIGSNNVYTNVGTPVLTYEHTPLDDAGNPTGDPVQFDVNSSDTPKVNVPIRFSTTDGESTTIFVGDSVDLKDLSNVIVEDAEYRAQLYNQINGTLTYTWTLPDGQTAACGTVTVKDGQLVDASFPDRSHVFVGTAEGQYTGKLDVTFAPEDTDDPSREACNALAKPGNIWINVIDQDSTTSLVVKKEWPRGNDDYSEVQFYLLANGSRMKDENGNDIIYTLSEENGWRMQFDDLPQSVADEAGNAVLIEYTVEEIVPKAYIVSYSADTEVHTTYKGELTLTLTPNKDIGKDKALVIRYTYGGVEYTYELPKATANYKKGVAYTYTIDVPLLDGELQELGSDFSVYINDKGNLKPTADAAASGSAEKVVAGSISIPVLVMSNTPAGYELPQTGGHGTLFYTICGIFLMIIPLLYGYRLRRRRERRMNQ